MKIKLQSKRARLKRKQLLQAKLKDLIQNYYRDTSDKEILEVLDFIEKNGVQMIPYEFMKRFPDPEFQVARDHYLRLPYIVLNGQRVYFPQGYSETRIQKQLRWALSEQHALSPHRYLTDDFNIDHAANAVLIGASNGIFGLSIVDKVDKLYLFEADKKWARPLRATFGPWGDKVEVIIKMVTDQNHAKQISLDNFFSTRNEAVNYIQADIEGGEKGLLLGAQKILEQNMNIKLSICCYHNQEDQLDFTGFLEGLGFKIDHSKGYLIISSLDNIKEPYLRRGVLYAHKKSQPI